jgi:hypothetical protein
LNPSSVFQFVLALVLLPLILRIARRIRVPIGREAFALAMVLIVVGFGMQAAGPLVPWTGLRLLRHLVLAAGGFSLAWAAWSVRSHERSAMGA